MSEHHVVPIRVYLLVFTALMVFTAITVAVAFVDLGALNNVVMLSIAVVKATLVVLYFMHVKYQSHLTKRTVATGLFFLAILLGMTLIDYVSKNFTGMPPLLQ